MVASRTPAAALLFTCIAAAPTGRPPIRLGSSPLRVPSPGPPARPSGHRRSGEAQPPPPHGRRRCLAKRASRLSGRALASDSFRWLGLTDLLVTKLVGSSRQRLPVNVALGRYIRRQRGLPQLLASLEIRQLELDNELAAMVILRGQRDGRRANRERYRCLTGRGPVPCPAWRQRCRDSRSL